MTRHAARTEPRASQTAPLSFPEDTYLWDAARRLVYLPVPKVACSSLKIWFLVNSPDLGIRPDPATWNANAYLREDGRRYLLREARDLRDERTFRFAFVRNPWSRLVSAYRNRIVSQAYEYRVLMKRLSRGPWFRLDKRALYYLRKHLRGQGWTSGSEVTFREFVLRVVAPASPMEMDPHWRPQHLFLGGYELDFLGRFERLTEDVEELTRTIGGSPQLPWRNASEYQASLEDRCFADCPPAELRAMPGIPRYRQFYTPELREAVARVYAEDIERFGYEF